MKTELESWPSVATIALLVLCACHSAPTHIYLLMPTPPATQIRAQSPMLRVDTVHVPPAWERIEILSPTPTGALKINDLDRWSAPLAQVTRQVLSADLDSRMLPGTVIYPHLAKSANALGINVDILEFTLTDSQSTLQASWMITPAQSPEAAKRGAATFTTAVAGTEPAAVARAWSVLVGQIADRIAADAASFSVP